MPNEVFAEDIEALLERLEGVAAARVVATDAGEIDRIYLTTSSDYDPPTVRRMVAAALMSTYSLALDGWRIRVARLQANGIGYARWRLHRLENVRTATSAKVLVELRADGAPGPPHVVGSAQGLPDTPTRLRTAAGATLTALRSVLEADGIRASLESVNRVSLADREAVVVAISVSGATHSEFCVGTSVITGDEVEAVIEATLDAVGKRTPAPEKRGTSMKDRREQLESMRAHYRQVRGPQRQMPTVAPAPEERQPAQVDEVVTDLAEVRPERPGGAAVGGREAPRPEVDRPRPVGRGAMEDDFLRQLVSSGAPVHILCRDGYQIPSAVLKGFGTYTLMVATETGDELVFKHGIISIRSLSPAPTAE